VVVEKGVRDLGMEPDYRLSVQDVYIRLAIAILKKDLNLDLFSVPRGIEGPEVECLPSWDPDWSRRIKTRSLPRWEIDNNAVPFKASGTSSSSPLFDHDYRRIGLEGVLVDEIVMTSRIIVTPHWQNLVRLDWFWDSCRNIRDVQNLFANMESVARARSRFKYITGPDILDVYWLTLRGGAHTEGYDTARMEFYKSTRILRWIRPFSSFLPVYHVLLTILAALALIRHYLGYDGHVFQPQTAFLAKCSTAAYWRIIRTKRGYVGLAPALSTVGDQIPIVKGGKLPLVIREERENWQLVGDSFIHGMMGGQVFEEEKCQRI
jgi:hypothetical protein